MCCQWSPVLSGRLALGALAFALLAPPVLGAAATRYSDKIVQNNTTQTEIVGEITEESIDGIKIISAPGPAVIGLRSILRVEYSDAPKAFKDGEDLRKAGRYEDAVPSYQAAMNAGIAREFWIKPACLFYGALCQLEAGGDPGAAESGFKELLKLGKTRYLIEAKIGLGRAQHAAGRYDEAVKSFDDAAAEARRRSRKDSELHAGLWKARAYLDAGGQLDNALDAAQKVKALCPPRQTDIRVQAEAVIASVLVRKAQYGEAIALLRESIKSIANLVADEMEKTPGDTRLRKTEAICFNTLGLAYFKMAAKEHKDKAPDGYREALLAFLWNVVLHGNAFPGEHATALDYASRCYRELKQDARANDLKEELKKSYPDHKAAP